MFAELSETPLLVYPDWDAANDHPNPFLVYFDASVDGFGGTLEQAQQYTSIRSIV